MSAARPCILLTLTMDAATLTMTLNSDIYVQVRSLIHNKLNDGNKFDLLVPLCESTVRPNPTLVCSHR